MPQITSCPECSKQLRVPDELIGKKVKCPGCATMFIAESDDQEEEEAPKKASERNRSDNVTSRGKSRDDQDDAPRSRRRDRDDDQDDAPPKAAGRGRSDGVTSTPRGKGRDDDRDDAPRSRGRDRDEDDDRRPSRSRRDDEDDEDRRPRRSRDDDDDDDDRPSGRRRGRDGQSSAKDRARGWQKVRTGTNFVLISGWLNLSLLGLSIVFSIIMALMIGTSAPTNFGGGFPSGSASFNGALGVLSCGYTILAALLGLSALVLLMVGTGFCMATPQLRGQSMRGLAVTAFYLYVGSIGASVFGFLALALMPPLGIMVLLLAMLAYFAGHVVWMVYLRLVCIYFKDHGLASAVMSNLIAQIVAPIVGTIVLVILGFALRSTGPAGGIVSFVFSIVSYVVMIAIWIWYLMTLRNVRDLVDR